MIVLSRYLLVFSQQTHTMAHTRNICFATWNAFSFNTALRKSYRLISAFPIKPLSREFGTSCAKEMAESCQVPSGKFGVDSKYKGLETNVWIELNSLNDELGNCVNLGQGFPDFQPAPHIVEHLAAVCKPDPELYSFHQYARAYGHPRLVKALAKLYSHLTGVTIDPFNEVLVTGGAYGALFYTIMANIGKGDEVIIIEPFFDCYEPMVQLAGGKPVFISLKPDKSTSTSSADWTLDMTELASLFNVNTKAIIINTPNNPLGKVFSRDELLAIGQLCIKHDVMIISDEVYEWIVYDNVEHVRIASLPNMWQRTVTIGSAGKTFSLTGWKLGWAYGPAHLLRNLQIAHQNCTYMCQTPEQEAVAVAFENEMECMGISNTGTSSSGSNKVSFLLELRKQLKNRREILESCIRAAGMIPISPQGGYFIMANWSPLRESIGPNTLKNYGEKLSPVFFACEDVRFVIWLAKQKQLLGVPPSAFYSVPHKPQARDYIRFNFYKKLETLEKAKEKLAQIAAKSV